MDQHTQATTIVVGACKDGERQVSFGNKHSIISVFPSTGSKQRKFCRLGQSNWMLLEYNVLLLAGGLVNIFFVFIYNLFTSIINL